MLFQVLTKLYPRDDPVMHMRDPLLPSHNYHRSVVVWGGRDDVAAAYGVFNRTVMWCDQKIDVGIFNPQTRFYFLSAERLDEHIFSFERYLL